MPVQSILRRSAVIAFALNGALWRPVGAQTPTPQDVARWEQHAKDITIIRDTWAAQAVTAGGESGHPESAHFADQATAYSAGALREVYFYRSAAEAHMERSYHPGQ